jgi:hypothetical protein
MRVATAVAIAVPWQIKFPAGSMRQPFGGSSARMRTALPRKSRTKTITDRKSVV